jgi:hypothetical protein
MMACCEAENREWNKAPGPGDSPTLLSGFNTLGPTVRQGLVKRRQPTGVSRMPIDHLIHTTVHALSVLARS